MMTYLLFGTSLGLSTVAAYYSIMGLVAIFAAAATPIIIMGSLLEVSKLVVASWLYRSWKKIPKLMMTYFTIALVVLMMLTSMGIFGYLSKAHLDQAVPTGDVAAKLSLIDEKIKTEKENIDAARKTIAQLDRQVDETISRTANQDNTAGVNRSISIRRSQQAERKRALDEIGTAQTKISKLNEERAPIAAEARKVEAEVGPIKYIAALIYQENASEAVLEKAVRLVIMMIVLVFDPLAVLLLIAANWQMKQEGEPKKRISDFVPQPTEYIPDEYKPDAWVADVTMPDPDEDLYFETESKVDLQDTPVVVDEIHIEPKKEWEPELYNRVGVKTTEKELGRYETDLLEQEKKRKLQSFLAKAGTIEHDVENLQK